MEQCPDHVQIVADMAVIRTDLKYIREKICAHVIEGEREGGFRDRLLIAEKEVLVAQREISVLKQWMWKVCLMAGFAGGLLGKLTPDTLNFLARCVFAQN